MQDEILRKPTAISALFLISSANSVLVSVILFGAAILSCIFRFPDVNQSTVGKLALSRRGRISKTPAPFMHDYPRAASRGFSLAWLLAITNSFVWLKAMQERNLCSQGRTWQKCMQTSFRFLHVSSNREHNGSCSNLVPRALFPGFGGGPGKSALGTRLCFLNY